MYGGNGNGMTWVGGFVLLAAVVALVLWLIPGTQLELLDPSVTDYDCDIRIGCDGRNLTAREITNISLERALDREAARARAYRMANPNEAFSQTNFQPGVDRPQIPELLDSDRLRTEDLMEGLTGRSHSDFVFTQFGNDGTVINPNVNPLYRPLLTTGGSEANLPPAARARAANEKM
jgi:hypothetical protein